MSDLRWAYVLGGTLMVFLILVLIIPNMIDFGHWITLPIEWAIQILLIIIITYLALLILLGIFFGWGASLGMLALTIIPIFVVGYVIFPFDFDFIPLFGWIDDLLVVIGGIIAQLYVWKEFGGDIMKKLK